ncbi:MAG: retroviral-like aspartic protease family protein [Burkholderiales bacterium]|nr:retroviral-like aspartic protease family protein [Burkholderiales bacterium]MDE1929268.1 retroviral-like aspartic protease family protein [Burkholderiales bacterium]MDE2093843.1 retroviral-like aspartic protease family protein [Burkholderiales bacterium]MDE2504527.1 retroviral-like aspartic protease family protein [Burkholderiales bacterium]
MAARLQQFPRLVAGALALLAAGAGAQNIVLAGRMGGRGLFVIDGRTATLAVGQSALGVKLLRWSGDAAEVESSGRELQLRLGAAPAQIGGTPPPGATREVVISAGPGGHFSAAGAIDGKPVQFLVDTGATLVSLSQDLAQQLGIDLSQARRGMTQTANGAVPIRIVTLSSVRVGELELSNVGAAIVPQPMPMVLLGNSFLARVQMRRDNDVMRLQQR